MIVLENTRPNEAQLKECLVSSPCTLAFVKSPVDMRVVLNPGDLWVHMHYKQEEIPDSFVLRFTEVDQASAFYSAYQILSGSK